MGGLSGRLRKPLQGRRYYPNHTIYVLQHIVLPEAQDQKAFTFEPCGSFLISGSIAGVCVLATIELDDEFWVEARKIDDVLAQRHLASQAMTIELTVSKSPP